MSNEKTGGPAYPVGEKWTERDLAGGTTSCSKGALHNGMTMLDHFAGQALNAMLFDAGQSDYPLPDYERPDGSKNSEVIAERSYKYAAAMIAERNRIMNEKP